MSSLLQQAMKDHRQPIFDAASMERFQLEQAIEDVRLEQDLNALSFEHNKACFEQQELTFAIDQIEMVQASIQGQALDENVQRATTCALESIDRSLGSLNLSLESEVTETIQRIWRAIKDAFRRALDTVVNFIMRLFGGVDRLEKKVQKVRDRIEQLEVNAKYPTPNSTFTTQHVHSLYIDGELTVEQLAQGARSVIYNLYPDSHDEVTSLYDLYLESLHLFFDSQGKGLDREKITSIGAKIDRMVGAGMTEISQSGRVHDTAGFIYENPTVQLYRLGNLPTLPGGYQAIIYVEKGKNVEIPFLSPIELHRIGDKDKSESNSPIAGTLPSVNVSKPRTNKAPVLTMEQSKALLQIVDQFIEKMRDNRSLREELLEKRRKVFEEVDKFVADQELSSKLVSIVSANGYKSLIRSVQKDHVKGLLNIDRYVFNYTRHLVDFINNSLTAVENQ